MEKRITFIDIDGSQKTIRTKPRVVSFVDEESSEKGYYIVLDKTKIMKKSNAPYTYVRAHTEKGYGIALLRTELVREDISKMPEREIKFWKGQGY